MGGERAHGEQNGHLPSYDSLDMDKASDEGPSGEDDDDEVQERDDERRFVRYDDVIGEGRFKIVYKGFDERQGIDVAWGVIRGDVNKLDESSTSQLLQVGPQTAHDTAGVASLAALQPFGKLV